ncbi:MAG TPA: G1 family glutamic endopeptidase [Candidatus Sulfotelmatobacter sp.]
MKRSTSFVLVALAVVAAMSFTTLAAAQRVSTDERTALFASAPRVQTKVPGVTVFAAPPKGFNPLAATNRELLSYGLPQPPDKTVDALGYQHWARAMAALKTTPNDVKALPYSSTNMRSSGSAPTANISGTPSFTTSGNWSGIANTNHNTRWSNLTSFDEVVSFFSVPVANHPFGNLPCTEGPWLEVTWNGIDGFSNGDVVQGGSFEEWDDGGCGGPVSYIGWVEWFPSYSILQINCGSSACPVGPGDDFEVVTFGVAGTAEQSVFVEDITQQWGGTFGLTWLTGPGLVGSSAEYIVERPCCNGPNLYPLANYVYEPMFSNYAYDGHGTLFYPGSASPFTYIITMLADDGSDISYPAIYGTAGNSGRYSVTMADEGCAFSGGCTP